MLRTSSRLNSALQTRHITCSPLTSQNHHSNTIISLLLHHPHTTPSPLFHIPPSSLSSHHPWPIISQRTSHISLLHYHITTPAPSSHYPCAIISLPLHHHFAISQIVHRRLVSSLVVHPIHITSLIVHRHLISLKDEVITEQIFSYHLLG